MSQATLKNIIKLYYTNYNDENVLKMIAFKAVEEALNSNLFEDIVYLFNSDVFSENFRNYLIKGFTLGTGLNEEMCINLISKEKVDFNTFELDELGIIADKFKQFRMEFKSTVFRDIEISLKEHILTKSFENKNYDLIKETIADSKECLYVRLKYLNKIMNIIPREDYINLAYKVNQENGFDKLMHDKLIHIRMERSSNNKEDKKDLLFRK